MRYFLPGVFAFSALFASIDARRKTSTSKTLSVDFGDYPTSGEPDMEQWLANEGLLVSDQTIGGTIEHTLTPDNVDIQDGALRLKVTGQSGNGTVLAAQIAAAADDILYGTFSVVTKASPVAGTCQGIFTYADDNHEVDIELLSSYYTTGYENEDGAVSAGLEFTNQPLTTTVGETNTVVPYGFDPTADFHEYTIEWTPTYSKFHVDGELKTTFTTNVPSKASQFMLNNWSNGNVLWSAGPPTEDSYFLVKSIDLKYTTA
ncbi:hypothetical protein JCM8097_000531 [Rhodosporidiobolus ruineniae]